VQAGRADDEEAGHVTDSPALRSLLFVPGDSERKQVKALASAADALLLDLEDSVSAENLPAARLRVRELLVGQRDRSRQQLWVRVNALSSGSLLEDLAAVFPGAPEGLMLPKVSLASEVCEISHYLAALEAQAGRRVGDTKLIVIATETAQAVLGLGGYAQNLDAVARQRLLGLTWGAEDLSAALGISRKTNADGTLTFTLQMARSMCLLAAAAIGVQAIDGVYVDFRNGAGLEREIQAARGDGFTGKMAIHPDQVGPINAAFIPGATEVEWARRIVAAFENAPQAGVVSLDGKMVDRPHLVQARRILDWAARGSR